MYAAYSTEPTVRPNSPDRWKTLAVFLGMIVVFCSLAASRGADANWDLRNYHQYNPFVLLNKPFGYDIVPAQIQTFLNPTLDLPYYFFNYILNGYPAVLNAVMALPQALAAFIAYCIALQVLPKRVRCREGLALIAIIFGASGTASLPTLGTSQSEMIPACFLLGGLFVGLRTLPDLTIPFAPILAVGMLCGIAFGLKLTLLPYCIAAGVALTVTCGPPVRNRLIMMSAFALGATAGAFMTAGYWWLRLYSSYGNPLFPYFNNFFHSPWYDPVAMTDQRFKPVDALHAIFYPFFWAINKQHLIVELDFRDPRMAVAYIAIIVTGLGAMLRAASRSKGEPWLDARGWCVWIFVSLGYVLWELQFSILRYLAPLELVSGVPMLLAVRPLLAKRRWWYAPHGVLTGLTVFCLLTTVYPEMGHAPPGPVAVKVVLPELAPNSLVILLDDSPMSFIAAYAPKAVRFVGANNNLISPGRNVGIEREVELAIKTHQGPIWGLEESAAQADVTLAYYGLRRAAGCVAVESNLNNNATRICLLVREGH